MRIPPEGQLTSYRVQVGKVPSLNAFYSSKHWTFRSTAKNKHRAEILEQLEAYDLVPITNVKVTARVNYRYDVDNSIMAVKFALDALKTFGAIVDDSKKYVKQIKILDDSTLEPNTAEIIFEGVS